MKLDINSSKMGPTYLLTRAGVIRIDPVLKNIDDCIEAVLADRVITIPLGDYSENDLAEYEAHLSSLNLKRKESDDDNDFLNI